MHEFSATAIVTHGWQAVKQYQPFMENCQAAFQIDELTI